jgi:ABC-2 type transport system ATP-binding protein
VHSAANATRFVRELLRQYGDDIADLEVRRASLEDTYMTMVRDFEAGRRDVAVDVFGGTR